MHSCLTTQIAHLHKEELTTQDMRYQEIHPTTAIFTAREAEEDIQVRREWERGRREGENEREREREMGSELFTLYHFIDVKWGMENVQKHRCCVFLVLIYTSNLL